MAPVVLVHGLWMPGTELALLERRLSTAGFDAWRFRYASVADDLDRNADRLADYVATVTGNAVHLLGHSLGAFVILIV